jgi:hypothetical protein
MDRRIDHQNHHMMPMSVAATSTNAVAPVIPGTTSAATAAAASPALRPR